MMDQSHQGTSKSTIKARTISGKFPKAEETIAIRNAKSAVDHHRDTSQSDHRANRQAPPRSIPSNCDPPDRQRDEHGRSTQHGRNVPPRVVRPAVALMPDASAI